MAQIKAKQIKVAAQGDLIIGDAGANGSILSIGAASQVVISNATTGAWGYLGQLIDPTGTVVVDTDTTPSQVNNFLMSGGGTGVGPTITAVGPDTNLDINLITKGTGEVLVPVFYTVVSNNALTTKQYVDSVATGLDFKNSVIAGTISSSETSGFTYTASADDETPGAAPWTNVTAPVFDGVTLVDGDRVLIKDSTDAKGNGIFTYDDGANTFVRADDADNSPENEVSGGMFVFIESGTQADTGWVMSEPNGVAVLGTDDLVFTQFSSAGSITPGFGLSQAGTDFNVNVDDVTTIIDGSNRVVVGHDDATDHRNQVLLGKDATGGPATATWTYLEDLRDNPTGSLIIDGVGVASAVNEIQVSNSATGNNVSIASVGGDTNVGITLTAKGTGRLDLDGTLWPDGGTPVRSILVTEASNDLKAVSAPDGAGDQLLRYNDASNIFEWVSQSSVGGNSFATVTGDTGSAVADSTSDTLNIAGGEGIVTVASDNPEILLIDMDITGLPIVTPGPAAGDEIVIYDISSATHVKVTVTELIDDRLDIFRTVAGDSGTAVADTSTDTLTIAGGEAITTIATDDPEILTIDLDINGLIIATPAVTGSDELVIFDISAGVHRKINVSEIASSTVEAFRVVTGDTGTATAEQDDTLNIAGGEGIVTVATDNPEVLTIDMDIAGLPTITPAVAPGDTIVIYDASTNTHTSTTVNQFFVDLEVGVVKYDDASATGGANEAFVAFFSFTPLADDKITVFFNGLSLRDTGWTRSGTTLTLVDAVNGYATESGDIVSARYETAP